LRRTYCDVHAVPVDEREELAEHLEDWDQGISSLNPEVAIKITSNVVLAILSRLDPDALDIPIDAETRIQVVEKMSHLGTARKHQFAAFVRQEGCLVVWSDDISTLIEAAEALEARFVQ
jgi:predicted N-formylglutamate amidohydrolase